MLVWLNSSEDCPVKYLFIAVRKLSKIKEIVVKIRQVTSQNMTAEDILGRREISCKQYTMS